MIDNESINNGIVVLKIKNYFIKIFNYCFNKKMLTVAIIFLPIFSITSIFSNQELYKKNYKDDKWNISTSTGDILKIDESINFSFANSQPYTKIEVLPDVPIKITWNDNKTKLNINSIYTWKKFKSYKIFLTKYENGNIKNKQVAIYKFDIEENPKILKSIPNIGAKKSILENDNKVRVFFDRNFLNYKFFAKAKNGDLLNTDFDVDNNVLTITLKTPIKERKTLEITIFGKYDFLKNDIDTLGIITMEVIPSKPNEWPENQNDRLKIASESTIPYIGDGKYIDVNLKSHITTLYNDGEIVYQFINSPGAKDSPTVTGIFKVRDKALKPLSNMFKVYLPYWVSFTDDNMYGFHGLVEWPANHPDFPNFPSGGKESIKNIDREISAGCIRHKDEDSKLIYEWSDIGTIVYVY